MNGTVPQITVDTADDLDGQSVSASPVTPVWDTEKLTTDNASPGTATPARSLSTGLRRSDKSTGSASDSPSKRKAVASYLKEHGKLPGHRDAIELLEAKQRTTERPLSLRHLFKKPVVKQYYKDGKLMRLPHERESYRFEIFFDLVYVGVLHQIADSQTEDLSVEAGSKVGTYLLTFYPSYIIWNDLRMWLNHSGTDDILQRIYLLFTMGVLVGYTANVTAIPNVISGNYEDARSPFVSAIAFLLTGSAVRLIRQILYFLALDRFRLYYVFEMMETIGVAVIFVPLAFIDYSIEPFVYLPPLAFGVGVMLHLSLTFISWKIRKSPMNARHYMPALEPRHYIERTNDFLVLVLGETVLSSTYSGFNGQTGIQGEFGRAFLAVCISFVLAWLYFAQASARRYIHAVRRHWISLVAFHTYHFSLTASIVLVGASAGRLTTKMFDPESETDQTELSALRWYLGASLAVCCFFLAALGHTHKPLDKPGSSLLHREVRIGARYAAALINALLPLASGLQQATRTLAVHTGIMFALLLIEVFGRLGSTAPDRHHSEAQTPKEAAHIFAPSLGVL